MGPFEARHEGNPVALGGPRQRAVLAALLFRANRTASIDYLCDAAWDSPPASPSSNLRTYISGLRQRFRPMDHLPERLFKRAGGYELAVGDGELDLTEFEGLSSRGNRALQEGDPVSATEHFQRALALWRGRPLEDQDFGPVLSGELARLEEQRLVVVERHARARIEAGDGSSVIGEVRRLLADHPLREELWAQLMLALCQSGRQAEALETFTAARGHLVSELGVEPGPRLRELQERILTADPTVLSPCSNTRPAHQQLPMDVAEFTGRAVELHELLTQEAVPTAPTVSVITGMPGVGKTRLAVHAAHELVRGGEFAEVQLWSDLCGFDLERSPADPSVVLERFLRQLGVPTAAIPEAVEDRAALYRDQLASVDAMLLLDNAADEEQIRPLLPGGARCRVLITSRRLLTGLEGARRVSLDVFGFDEAVDLLTRIAGKERVDAEAGAARRLIECCDALPGAIALAARKLQAHPEWPIDELAGRLDAAEHRIDHLSVGSQRLDALFDLSYRALPVVHQRVFRLLSLHPGQTFTSEATAALAGIAPHAAETALEALIDEHLVQFVSARRYRLHGLLRCYARNQVSREESPNARRIASRRVLEWHECVRAPSGSGRCASEAEKWCTPLAGSLSVPNALPAIRVVREAW